MSEKIEENAISELQKLMSKLHQNQRQLREFLETLPPLDSEIFKPKLNANNNKDLQPNMELFQLNEQAMEIGYDIQIILKELKTAITLAEAKITTSSDMKSTVRQQLLNEVNTSFDDTNNCISLCIKFWTHRQDIAKNMFKHSEMLNEGLAALQSTNKQCLCEIRSRVMSLLQRLIVLHQLWEANKDVLVENENMKLMY